jgi:hypothetical protein
MLWGTEFRPFDGPLVDVDGLSGRRLRRDPIDTRKLLILQDLRFPACLAKTTFMYYNMTYFQAGASQRRSSLRTSNLRFNFRSAKIGLESI